MVTLNFGKMALDRCADVIGLASFAAGVGMCPPHPAHNAFYTFYNKSTTANYCSALVVPHADAPRSYPAGHMGHFDCGWLLILGCSRQQTVCGGLWFGVAAGC
jgi:hypothetical protein